MALYKLERTHLTGRPVRETTETKAKLRSAPIATEREIGKLNCQLSGSALYFPDGRVETRAPH